MNKVVVITGASSGIGLELYNQYLQKGEIPICLSRKNECNLENYIYCDVTKEEDIILAFKEIQKKYTNIDILIINAGFGISGAIELTHSSTVEHLFNVNFMGAFLCYKYALPLLKEGSKIVNISSICALIPVPFRGFYCASKSALNLLSLTEYMELKSSKIDVITICPGQTISNFDKNRIRNLETNDRYKNSIYKANESLTKSIKHSMKTHNVAKTIINQTYKKHPKVLKIIGFKYKLIYFFYKILPLKLFLKINNNLLGK